jgi:primary-amine oxidase
MAIPQLTAHPLEPLARDELERAAGLVRERLADARFVSVGLLEPAKDAYLAWVDGGARPARCALAIVVAPDRGLRELACDLDAGAIVSETAIAGAHSPITPEDYEAAAEAVRADAGWREALRRRGVEDVSLVQIDVLASGGFGLEVERGRRVARAVAYLLKAPGHNGYAHPIESLIAYVDVDELRVLEVEELDVKPIPLAADGAYAAGSVPLRDDLRPIEIAQPEGVSFTVSGNEIAWYRWSLRVAIDPQEGLVLHDVRFDGRPVLHRASCAEMIVPYGEPHAMHAWRTYFDAGEYGLGACTNSLALGCDCVGEIRYLDAHLVDRAGRARAVANAICLHEEDAGLLWKHTDELAGRVEVRRARRFVVNSMVTVGNYDYAFRWYLHLDGSIECEVQLHGIVSTMALAEGEEPAGSSVVDRGLAAPNHQHFFCFRLDLDVDGVANSVREVESEAVPAGPGNPLGNAFRARVTPLASESVAGRDSDDRAARVWHVVNPARRNALGGEVGYRLVPQYGVATMLAQPDARVSQRAGFARRTLWVTRHDDGERHPSGRYPYGQAQTVGLPQWCEADRALEETDVVLWYTVGTTHFVRPEDWPIMPVARAGFRLEPVGFFDRNPSLDVPPPRACHAVRAAAPPG